MLVTKVGFLSFIQSLRMREGTTLLLEICNAQINNKRAVYSYSTKKSALFCFTNKLLSKESL